MTEDYADEIDDTLDDIERVVEDPSELYEHFRVVVDKGQSQVRIDKYLFERLVNSSRNRIQKAADAGFVMANGTQEMKDAIGRVVRYSNEEDGELDILEEYFADPQTFLEKYRLYY